MISVAGLDSGGLGSGLGAPQATVLGLACSAVWLLRTALLRWALAHWPVAAAHGHTARRPWRTGHLLGPGSICAQPPLAGLGLGLILAIGVSAVISRAGGRLHGDSRRVRC